MNIQRKYLLNLTNHPQIGIIKAGILIEIFCKKKPLNHLKISRLGIIFEDKDP